MRTNCPSSPRWSTSKRIASQSLGASCHSSINLGTAPFNSLLGFISAIVIFCDFFSGSSMYNTLAASCSAVVVLPHHFGPSISTAPCPSSFRFKISSAILFLYFFIGITPFHFIVYSIHPNHAVDNHFPTIGGIFFRRLAEYFSDDWRKHIRVCPAVLYFSPSGCSCVTDCSSEAGAIFDAFSRDRRIQK